MLSNSKQEALSVALDGGRREGGGGESSVEDLTRAITDDIRRMPGNNNCCDCGAPGNLSQPVNQSDQLVNQSIFSGFLFDFISTQF